MNHQSPQLAAWLNFAAKTLFLLFVFVFGFHMTVGVHLDRVTSLLLPLEKLTQLVLAQDKERLVALPATIVEKQVLSASEVQEIADGIVSLKAAYSPIIEAIWTAE